MVCVASVAGRIGMAAEAQGQFILEAIPAAHFQLHGFVGERVQANAEHWLSVAPQNNPGLLDMFARRDSGVKPDLMPWAGEFVGKYLISGVQALRMSDDPKLKQALQQVVDRLLALQAEDGYLGPWPKPERLRGQWDLWGHYHVLLGLLMWSEHTGDRRAQAAAERIADLVCQTCLGTGFRVFDAGSQEMNMAILHGLALMYEKTGTPSYLQMAKDVLQDFQRAGDYYRTGLAGKEYFRTPRPRWESLHSVQGLAELYRITGDASFRQAFLHHWASLRRFDFRNTGAFSSGEQATGNPFRNDAIETCCVVAWQTVMIDALRLTGDATIADDLELSTLNAMLGAQHPSGAWCTYDTPMAGQRLPSHIQINFQARPGAPHLNCCSVNGPRGYGSISQWGLMRLGQGVALPGTSRKTAGETLVVNYFGPLHATLPLADGTPVTVTQETDYPVGGKVTLKIETKEKLAQSFTLALRIPAWSKRTQVDVNGTPVANVTPGRYLELERSWQAGDRVTVQFDMTVRCEPGDLEQYGQVSLYRGPLLLAWDSRFGAGSAPQLDVTKLDQAQVRSIDEAIVKAAGAYRPWLVLDVPAAAGGTARLLDFASAGATTTDGKPLSSYTSWLPAANLPPPRPVAWQPADRSIVGPGPIRFVWRKPATPALATRKHTVVVSASPTFESVLLSYGDQPGDSLIVPPEEAAKLQPQTTYFWKIVARNEHGQAESVPPYKQFRLDPTAPSLANHWPYGQRDADQMIVAAPLTGDVKPSYGELLDARGWKPATGVDGKDGGAIELDGRNGLVRYRLLQFPEESFAVSVWVSVTALPTTQYGQIFSGWAGGGDDPLRLFISGGKLSARIEAGKFYDTESVPVQTGEWYHIAGVKQETKLTLYVDGQARSTIAVPASVTSQAADFALGGNPHFAGGPEFLAARLADLRCYARALSADEVSRLHRDGPR